MLVMHDLLLKKLLLSHYHIIMNVGLIIIHQIHCLVVQLQLTQLSVLTATIIHLLEPSLTCKLPALFWWMEFLELLVLEVFGGNFAIVTLYWVTKVCRDLIAFFGSNEFIFIIVLSDYVIHVYHLLRCVSTSRIVMHVSWMWVFTRR